MNDARLQVAFAALHPERVRSLLATHGARGTRSRLLHGAIDTTDRVRAAVAVDAATRRVELAEASTTVLYRGEDGYAAHLAELPDALICCSCAAGCRKRRASPWWGPAAARPMGAVLRNNTGGRSRRQGGRS